MKKHQLATLLWLVSSISGQTLVDVRTQTKNVDFSGAASTIPEKSGSTLPASCKVGEMFFNTANAPGQNLYLCAPANTWTMLAGGAGSGSGSGITVPAATTVGNIPQYASTTGTALSAGLSVVTSVGTPGSDTNIPTEAAVRSAISAVSGGGASNGAFSNLAGGTNTSAAMIIGSGASLASTGSGTIAATSIPASGVTGLAPSATTDTTNASNITSGTLSATLLPNPTTTTLGGVQAAPPTPHQWVNSIATSGVPALSQPTAADINGLAPSATTDTTNASNISSGTLSAGRLPTPSATTLGGVQAAAPTAHQWVNSISTSGVPALSQPTTADIAGLAPSATTDTTNASNISTGTLAAALLPKPSATALGGVQAASPAAHQWVNGISTSGAPSLAQPAISDIAGGTTTNAYLVGPGGSLSPAGGTISATSSQVLQVSSHIAEGDSITAGYEANGVSGATVGSAAFPALLGTSENATVTNRAIGGSQACDMAVYEAMLDSASTLDNNSTVYTMLIGTNDAHVKAGIAGYDAVFQNCHKAAIAWDAVANKFAANGASGNNTTAGVANCTNTGTWASWNVGGISPIAGAYGEYTVSAGATKSCPVFTPTGTAYVWVYLQDNNTGAYTVSVDGVLQGSYTTATTPTISTQNHPTNTEGYGLIRLTGLTPNATHTILFAATAGTSSSNGIAIVAIGTPPATATYAAPRVYVGGVPKQQGDAQSTYTAEYNADVLADVNLLAGDGLNVYFVPVRNYLCTSVVSGVCYNNYGVADMNTPAVDPGGFHPNQVGQNDLKQAFAAVEQFVPYPSVTSSGGSGTVTSASSGQFAYYTAAGTTVSGHTLVAADIPALSYDASGAAAAAQAASLQKSNNLSDLANAATARSNLGLGTAATQATTAFQAPLTFTGTGAKTVSGTAAGVSGNCAKWDANGNVTDAGSPCGSGSGGSSAFSALTPGTNTAGSFVLGNGASLSTTGTGTITATSVPASGVSGTLAAANLPPPTTSTLGGVQSISAVNNQWINSIGTSGVPTLSQPAFSNLSGNATSSQMPVDYCVLTGYTVAASNLSSLTPVTAPLYPIPSLTLASNQRICFIDIRPTTAFTATGATSYTVRLQSGASTPVIYSPNQDVSSVSNNDYWTDAGSIADRSNSSVVAAFTFTGATAPVSAGSVNIVIGVRTMPSGY